MPRANFDEDLKPASGQASGPIHRDVTVRWVWVWIVQNKGDTAAAARGYGTGPFTDNWQSSLSMANPSDLFVMNKRADAYGVALTDMGGDDVEMYWWADKVWIRP
jgi:hypothetical protein